MEKIKEEKADVSTTNNEEPAEPTESVPVVVPIAPEEAPGIIPQIQPVEEKRDISWTPRTSLGRQVFEGKIKSIDEILFSGKKIIEPGIVDQLVPNLQSELILIGGRPGKGGGAQRVPNRIT